MNTDHFRVPAWSWINTLSLDAVCIGLFWMTLVTRVHCNRWPSFAEASVIGLSIWLAYTADRLLDSLKLDISRPHTLRHRIHLEYRRPFVAFWIMALLANTYLIMYYATSEQLRWGYAGVAVVIAYIASAHLAQTRIRASRGWSIPKELQAGMVFAMGVSFVAWTEQNQPASISLVTISVTLGLLFSLNCFAVASWEDDLDAQQRFPSWVTRFPSGPRWLPKTVLAHAAATVLLAIIGALPLAVAGCAIASGLLMRLLLSHSNSNTSPETSKQLVQWRSVGLIADAAIVLPPLAWILIVAGIQ
ncbi:MAG: hypothetical protein AB8B91_04875 [Rubripirellula sp.]